MSELYLSQLPNRVDLQGLERLELDDIVLGVYDAPQLTSLRPLVFPAIMQQRLLLALVPNLVDLGDMSRLETNLNLELTQTGLANLSPLSNLRSARILQLTNNERLEDVSALGGLEETELFTIHGHPLLRELPAFPLLSRIGNLDIENNDRLETLGSYPLLTQMSGGWSGQLKVRNNVSLQQIDGLAGLEQTDRVLIQSNASLRSISLPGLRRVTQTFYRHLQSAARSRHGHGALRRTGPRLQDCGQ